MKYLDSLLNEPEKWEPIILGESQAPQFLVKWEINDYYLKFDVVSACIWNEDNTISIESMAGDGIEFYLTGTIKWDGCSHVWFGEKDEDDSSDGYLHLCGKSCFDNHIKLMEAVWDKAEKSIKHFDKEVAR